MADSVSTAANDVADRLERAWAMLRSMADLRGTPTALALQFAFAAAIDPQLAELVDRGANGITRVLKPLQLTESLGMRFSALARNADAFYDAAGAIIVPFATTRAIARAACRARPAMVESLLQVDGQGACDVGMLREAKIILARWAGHKHVRGRSVDYDRA